MQFKLQALVLLTLINFSYSAAALAVSNPPLDFIELLGEIDDDSMLTAALNELENKPGKNQKKIAPKTATNKIQSQPYLQEATKNEHYFIFSAACHCIRTVTGV